MFHILFHLLALPFVLIRMAFGVLGISTHILLIPLKIFARHTVLCLAVIAILILYLALKKEPAALNELKPAPTAARDKQAKATPKGAPPLIEPVARKENGDSAFATDVYSTMTDLERNYYSAVFYQTMSTVKDGEPANWSYYNIHGSLRPIRTFQNNRGETCRAFTEVLKVHRVEQTISGTSCQNGGGTWCKLKPNATPACGLSRSGGGLGLGGITNAVKNLF